jgi:Tfp pilus assembly protein PilV
MRRTERRDRGFTLVSVLISITMIAIGLMALARTESLLARTSGGTQARAAALAIAQDYVEVLRGRAPMTLATEPTTPVDGTGQPNAQGAYQRSTTVSVDQPNLRRVTVQVDYPGGAQPIELVTLIFGSAP